MRIEYGYYDIASDEKEVKENIEHSLDFSPSSVSVLPQYLKLVIKSLLEQNINAGTIIDYPFGLSNSKSREDSVVEAIDKGANYIEVVCPNFNLCNRKYEKFRIEIDKFTELCGSANVELRYVLDYKIYNLNLLQKVSQILASKKIFTVYPSVGFLMDAVSDNILVGMLIIKKNPEMNVIFNGQAWTDQHIDLILSNSNIKTYKTSNIHTLEKIVNKINKK